MAVAEEEEVTAEEAVATEPVVAHVAIWPAPPRRTCSRSRGGAAPGVSRYPKLSLEQVVRLSPEVVLLPDEPYAFGEADARELAEIDIPAAVSGRIHLIDGTWASWYGPRIRPAIRALRELLAQRF